MRTLIMAPLIRLSKFLVTLDLLLSNWLLFNQMFGVFQFLGLIFCEYLLTTDLCYTAIAALFGQNLTAMLIYVFLIFCQLKFSPHVKMLLRVWGRVFGGIIYGINWCMGRKEGETFSTRFDFG